MEAKIDLVLSGLALLRGDGWDVLAAPPGLHVQKSECRVIAEDPWENGCDPWSVGRSDYQPEVGCSPDRPGQAGGQVLQGRPCVLFDIFGDDEGGGLREDKQAAADAAVQTLEDCINTVVFRERHTEQSLRTCIDEMKASCVWESVESTREPDTPCVIKVLKSFVTIDGGSEVLPVELPAGIIGVVGGMDEECDLYVFFPDLLDKYK